MKKIIKVLGKVKLKKIIALITVFSFICSQTGFAQMIVIDNKTSTEITSGGANITNIHTNTSSVSGKTGFNSFEKFDVDPGQTVNMYLNNKADSKKYDNLVNIVDGPQSNIYGTLEAYRNGKIGGNVFFLNPNGIVIGASGIVNVGALTLVTPKQADVDAILSNGFASYDASAFAKSIKDGNVPINQSGTISVKGKINAYYGAAIHAGEVEIGNGTVGSGQIHTLKAADITNLDGKPTAEIKKIGGRILITAKEIDINNNASIKSIKTEGAGAFAGNITISAQDHGGALIDTRKATVDIGKAKIEGNDVTIEAKASNTYNYEDVKDDLNLSFDLNDLNSDTALKAAADIIKAVSAATGDVLDAAFAKSDVSASVTIEDGAKINADNDINIKTDVNSQVTVKTEADSFALAAGVNLAESKISIGNVAITAANDLNIEAKSKVTSTIEAIAEKGNNPSFPVKGAFGVSVMQGETSVILGETANLHAVGGNLNIKAITNKTSNTTTKVEKEKDTKFGLGIGLNFIDVKNNVVAKGIMSAGKNAAIISSGDNRNPLTNNNEDTDMLIDGSVTAKKDIKISGKNIIIKDDSSLKSTGATKGDIKISAEDSGAELISTRKASINIGKAKIEGNDVTIEAKASNTYEFEDLNDTLEIKSLTDTALQLTNEILEVIKEATGDKLDAAVAKSDVSASVTIADEAKINADNNINIKTDVNSQVTVKTEADNFALAAGINIANSKISIGNAAIITAKSDLNIEAESTVTSTIEAIAKKSEDDSETFPVKGAFGVSVMQGETSVILGKMAELQAGGDLNVKAITNKTSNTTTKVEKEKDTKFGLGIGLNFIDVKNNVEAKGTMSAGKNAEIISSGDNRNPLTNKNKDTDMLIDGSVTAVNNITIKGKNIIIEDGSSLKSTGATKGDIKISAEDSGAELISTRKASISIGKNAEIVGKDVTIEAKASNTYKFEDLNDTLEIKGLTDSALQLTNEIIGIIADVTGDAINGAVAKSDTSASVTIADGAKINADNNINITTDVDSQVKVKAKAKGLGVAVGINLAESKIDIGKADLKAGKNINIEAKNKVVSEIESKAASYKIAGMELGGAVGVSMLNSNTSVNLAEGSSITAKEDIIVNALTEKAIEISVETKAGENANAGLGVAVNLSDSKNSVSAKGVLKSGKDINIQSKIDSKKNVQKVSSSTGNKEEDESQEEKNMLQQAGAFFDSSNLQGKTDAQADNTNKNSGIEKDSNGNKVTLAGSVLYSDHSNAATAEISGSGATVEAANDLNLNATVIDANIKQFVDAVVSNSSKVSGTGAVVISEYNDKAEAFVDGASLDAGKNINVTSNYEMPFDASWFDVFKDFKTQPNFDSGKAVFDQLKDGVGELKDSVVNSWVRSSAAADSADKKEEGGSGEGGGGESGEQGGGSSFTVAASGAVNLTDYNSTSNAYIKNAKINQKTDASLRTGNQKVNVKSDSKTTSVTVGGVFGKSYKSPMGQSADVGVGGTYNQIRYKTENNAYIEGSKTNLYANDVNIAANHDQLDVTVGIAGGESSKFGLQGVFNWVKSDNNVNAGIKGDADGKANIVIEKGKILDEKGNLVDGKLNIEAKHTPILVNVAGSLSKSEQAAVGISAAVTDIDRKTNAFIDNSKINTKQKTSLYALNDGLIHSYAIAAAMATKKPPKAKPSGPQATNPNSSNMADKSSGTSGGAGDSGGFGLGISGSAGVANITGEANAYINNETEFKGTKELSIKAREESDIINAAGGVSIAANGASTGVAVAGAGSISWVDNNASAFIDNSIVTNDGDINIKAESDGGIVSVAAGLAGSTASSGATVAGSATVNITGNKTQAYINNSTVTGKGKLDISAADKSKIFSLAGAVSATSGAAGIGAAVGVNVLNNLTSARINSSDVKLPGNDANKKINLNSRNSSNILSVSGAVGLAAGSVGVAVTAIVNVINNETEAYIKGKKDTNGKIEAGNIEILSADNSKIFSAAGSVGGGNSVGVGVGIGVNVIKNSITSYIKDAAIEVLFGNIEMQALSKSDIDLIIASIGIGGTVGVVGNVGVGTILNNAHAYIDNSTLSTDGSIGILAENKDTIDFYSGSVGIGGTAGVGGNLGFNFVSNKAIAEIRNNSEVNVKGSKELLNASFGTSPLYGLVVKSNINDVITVYNAALAGSGTAAVSGGVTGAMITNESTAKISDSKVNESGTGGNSVNQSVHVLADNEASVAVRSAAVSGSGNVAVSVASDFLVMKNKVNAAIVDSVVKSKKDVNVQTSNTEKYDAKIVSGAVGVGVAGVAGNVVVAVNDSENNAFISNSAVDAGKDINVKAVDEVIIGDRVGGVILGTVGIGLYAGIAGGVMVNTIFNKTRANIIDSNIKAGNKLALNADSSQKTLANLATGGAGIAGIAITAGVGVVNTETEAVIKQTSGKKTVIEARDIAVNAKNDLNIKKMFVGMGAGIVGVTGGVSVGIYNNDVSAGIGNGVKAIASNDVSVKADNIRNIKDTVVSTAGGAVGVTGSVSVITVGTNLKDPNDEQNSQKHIKDVEGDITKNTKLSDKYTSGQIGGGGLIANDTIGKFDADTSAIFGDTPKKNGTNAFIGEGAEVKADGNIDVKATDTYNIETNLGGASGGGVSVGATVGIVNLNSATNAYIGKNASIAAGNNITVKAKSAIESLKANAFMGTYGGTLGLSAIVAVLNLNNNTNAYIGNNAKILGAKDVNVFADAKSDIENNVLNASVSGGVAVGGVVAVINKGGETNAFIGDNVKIGEKYIKEEQKPDGNGGEYPDITEVVNKADSVTVKAATTNNIKSASVSASGGIMFAAQVNVFKINLTDKLSAYTGSNVGMLINKDLNVLTEGKSFAASEFAGATFSGQISIAAAVADIEISLNNHAYIGQNNTIDANNITVSANQTATAGVVAIAATGGKLVAASGTDSKTKISGLVDAVVKSGSNLQATGNINISALNNTIQKAENKTATVGTIAVGVSLVSNTVEIDVKAEMEEGVSVKAAALTLNSDSSNEMEVTAASGSGGAVSAGGVIAETNNTSTSKVVVGSGNNESNINVSKFNAYAKNKAKQNAFISSLAVALASGAVAKAKNSSVSDVVVDIGGKTNINANHVDISAVNEFEKKGTKDNLASLSVSLLDIYIAESVTEINNNTKVNFGKNTNIKTSRDENKNSIFTVNALNIINADDKVVFEAGAAGAVSSIKSEVASTANAEVNFKGKVRTGKDIIVNARTDQDIKTNAYMSVYAAIGALTGKSLNNSTINNSINILSGGDVFAGRNAYFNLSIDDLGNKSKFYVSSIADIFNKSLISIDPGSQAIAIMKSNDNINIASGGSLKSGTSIHFTSSEGIVQGTGLLSVFTPYGEVATKDKNRVFDIQHTSKANIDGSAIAGINNTVNINITQKDTSGNIEYLVEIDNQDADIEYTTNYGVEFINKLFNQLNGLKDQLANYTGSGATETYLKAEISRLEADMENMGFTIVADANNKVVLGKIKVDYINFGDIHAGMGDIIVNMDDLVGTGKLAASNTAEINIVNRSGAFLEFKDILIGDDATGNIYFKDVIVKDNAAIEQMNKNKANDAKFSNITTASEVPGESKITILSTTAGSGVGSMDRNPNIDLTGDIENLKGSVTVTADGSIYSNGRIVANDVNIKSISGDIVQSYFNNDFVFHVGGSPQGDWSGVASENEKKYAGQHNQTSAGSGSGQSDKAVSESGKSSIIGNNVYISGKYLNINGLIQAGIADWTLDVADDNISLEWVVNGKTYTGGIDAAWKAYNENGKTLTDSSFKLAQKHGNINAYYNVLTKEIEVQNIKAEGGKLELYGTIMNTSTSGFGILRALNGYAKVKINNNSSYNVNLKNINTSNMVEGHIKITDLGKKDLNGTPLESIYTVHEDGRTVKKDNRSTGFEYSDKYKPTENQRYNWTTGTQQTNQTTYYKEDNSFWFIDWNGVDMTGYEVVDYNPSLKDPLSKSEYLSSGAASSPLYQYEYKRIYGTAPEIVSDKRWSTSKGWWIFSIETNHHEVVKAQGTKNFNTHSIKADNDIKIEFIGHKNAQDMSIVSNKSNIMFKGALNSGENADVNVTSGKAIDSLGGGSINAKNITLEAIDGIGNSADISVTVQNGGKLNATTTNGNINISGKRNNLHIQNIVNLNGNVKITSEKDLFAANSNSLVRGKNIELHSKTGSIAKEDGSAMQIKAEVISASAQKNIVLEQANGDLGINSIISVGGDVSLNVKNGSIYDKNINDYVDERKKDELLSSWSSLALFEGGAGWTEDQLVYAMNTNIDKMTNTQYIVEDNNIVGGKVDIKASGSIGMDDESFSFKINEMSTLTDIQKLRLTTAEHDSIIMSEDKKTITILNKDDIDLYAKKAITAEAGGHIYLGSAENINIDTIKAGTDINVKGAKGIFNAASGAGANITGKNLIIEAGDQGIGTSGKALTLDLSGTLTARTAGDAYFGSPDKDLALYYINTGGNVFINTINNITNARVDKGHNIFANGITVSAKNIGSKDKNINVVLKKKNSEADETNVLNVVSSDSFYINNVSEENADKNLYIGVLSAVNNAVLNSVKGDILNKTSDSKVTAKNISLNAAEGNIGTAGSKIKVSALDIVTATAKADINLLSKEANNKFGILNSSDGKINIHAKNGVLNMTGAVNAKGNIDITAEKSANILETVKSSDGGFNANISEDLKVSGAVTAKQDISLTVGKDFINTATIASTDGQLTAGIAGKANIDGSVSSKKDIDLTVGKDLKTTAAIESKEGKLDAQITGNTEIGATVTAKQDISLTAGKDFINTAAIESKEGKLDAKITGNTEIGATVTAKQDISLTAGKDFINTAAIESKEGKLDAKITGDTEIGAEVTAKQDITLTAGMDLKTTAAIESKEGKLDAKITGNTEIGGAVTAKQDISLTAGKDFINTAAIASTDGHLTAEIAGKANVDGSISSKKDIDLIIGKDLKTTAAIESKEGKLDAKITGNTEIGAEVTAKKDIEINAGKNFESLAGGDVLSKIGNVRLQVVDGFGKIGGAVQSLQNINFNILNSYLLIGNKVLAEDGTINAYAYGSINDDGISLISGLYAKDIDLRSMTEGIGTKNNPLRVGNDGTGRKTRIGAHSVEGLYIDGFDTDLLVVKFLSEKGDIILESNRDIEVESMGNKKPNFKANNITLHAGGAIGSLVDRAVVETWFPKGNINLSSVDGIYLDQYTYTFYSDYVKNLGGGVVSLFLPDSHAFIRDVKMSNSSVLNIEFADKKYVKGVNINYNDIKQLVVHPLAVQYPVKHTSAGTVSLLSEFENNIGDNIEEILNGSITVGSIK